MKVVLASRQSCNGCQACKETCPKSAISMKKSKDGFVFPEIDDSLCITCQKCVKICPILNGCEVNEGMEYVFAAKSKYDDIRMKSSSGGIFTHIAEYILGNGGIVVGAAFSKDFYSVEHILVSKEDDLSKLRGSKYLQSNISGIYKKVQNELINEKYVLFSGTGCQIAGLKNYLGKEYEKLITVDVVCHGAPSQDLWSKYLKILEKKNHAKAIDVQFRSKKIGWAKSGLKVFGTNVYFKSLFDDEYLRLFQKNISLRESCFTCKFKSKSGISDISIGDLWGASRIVSNFNDDKGISFVYIHSGKGKQLLDAISNKIFLKQIRLQEAVENNRNISVSSKMPDKRGAFYEDMNRYSLDKVIKRYTKDSYKESIKKFLKSFFLIRYVKRILHRDNGENFDKNLDYGLMVVFDEK